MADDTRIAMRACIEWENRPLIYVETKVNGNRAWIVMNYKNEQLLKIGLDVIKNCDDYFAIHKLYLECHEKLKNMAIPRQIGPVIEEDVF